MTAFHLGNPNNLLLLILPGEEDDAKALRTLVQQHRSDHQLKEQAISTEAEKQGIIRKMEENIIGVTTWIEPKAREVALVLGPGAARGPRSLLKNGHWSPIDGRGYRKK